jgi:RNA polymerase sigma-70 factor (ECF subfamily)
MSEELPKRRSPRKRVRDIIGRLLGGSPTDQAAMLRSFLLNVLPEDDRVPIEARILSDEAFYAVVVAAEQELLDAYAHGELSTADAERVAQTYGSSPVRLQRARVAQALRRAWGREASPPIQGRSAVFGELELAVAVRGEGPTPEESSKMQLIARRMVQRAPKDFPLSPDSLLSEVYARISTAKSPLWNDRTQFLAVAAALMRRVIVEHARAQGARVRQREPAAPSAILLGLESPASEDFLLMDRALNRLEKEDPRKSNLIELRYFAGLTVEEIATALNLPVRTIKRDLVMATAWMKAAMARPSS